MEKLKGYMLSLAIGYVIIFVLFLITSIIFAYTNIQDDALNIAIYICLGVSTLVSSFLLGMKVKEKGAIIGIIFGAIFYGLVFLIGSVISGFEFSTSVIIYFLISIIFSTIGAVLGVNI